MTYVPFGASADQPPALKDGTPDWMFNSLRDRFKAEFTKFVSTSGYLNQGYHEDRIDRLRKMELETQIGSFSQIAENRSVGAVFDMLT